MVVNTLPTLPKTFLSSPIEHTFHRCTLMVLYEYTQYGLGIHSSLMVLLVTEVGWRQLEMFY